MTVSVPGSQPNHSELAMPAVAAILPLLLNREQVADLLGISDRTVKRMTALGTIPGVRRLGRSVRYSRPDLEDWVRRGCPPNDGRRGKR